MKKTPTPLAIRSYLLAAATTAFVITNVACEASPDPWLRPATAPAPADNANTPERADLGRMLFFDSRLSAKSAMSCASCHNPSLGWSDGRATAVGHDMKVLRRATPTIVNAAFNARQMWDGRAASLEAQATMPYQSPDEQNLPGEDLVKRVQSIHGYTAFFAHAYPGEDVTLATIAKAIASFERTVLSNTSPFDRWRNGDTHAISSSAQNGFALFTGKANCSTCHQGFNFTDNSFYNVGVASTSGVSDLGRYEQLKLPVLKGAFKTPTLRDIALTAPYMHNGAYRTLDDVVDHYDRGGDTQDNLSAEVKPLHLTPSEKHDLVEFLNTLTGDYVAVAVPKLPQ
jgi:cytochrome c peroxidase